jgi:hypothetical protein
MAVNVRARREPADLSDAGLWRSVGTVRIYKTNLIASGHDLVCKASFVRTLSDVTRELSSSFIEPTGGEDHR